MRRSVGGEGECKRGEGVSSEEGCRREGGV